MASREQVLSVIRGKGPLIPAVIAKELEMPLLIAQAHLSDLSSQSMVRVSNLKFGGSPLYYIEGQESQLQRFTDRLGEKDKRTYDKLKKEKVIRESTEEPLTRVSLRSLRDFAVKLEVRTGQGTEIFWRWYLCSNEEVTPMIKSMIGGVQEEIPQEEPSQVLDLDPTPDAVQEPEAEPIPEPITPPEPPQEEVKAEVESEPEPEQEPASKVQQDAGAPAIAQAMETVKQVFEQEEENGSETFYLKLPEKSKPIQNKQRSLAQEILSEKAETQMQMDRDDPFIAQLYTYFSSNDIRVIEYTLIRRKAEAEFVLVVPSAVGNIEFYCRAKQKKKCNEGDLSTAYLEGTLKKLPTLFLTTGELPKKVEKILHDKFKGMIFRKLEG